MIEMIISFIVLSYIFVLLLKFWIKNAVLGSKECKCKCENDFIDPSEIGKEERIHRRFNS